MQLSGTFSWCMISFCTGSIWSVGWQVPVPVPIEPCNCPVITATKNDPLPQSSTSLRSLSGEESGGTRERPSQQPPQQANHTRFNPSLRGLVVGAARTNSRAFSEAYDTGIPYAELGVQDVLILYSEPQSLPSNLPALTRETHGDGIPELSADQSTENCDLMNIVHVQSAHGHKQCLAIVGHHMDSSISHMTFMRVKKRSETQDTTDREPDSKEILRHVGQGVDKQTGEDWFHPPHFQNTAFHYSMMREFIDHLDQVVQDVGKIVNRIAKQNTVVAIATNKGYSDLLMNFVCRARSRGIDLSNVLVFATDIETKDLAEGMGLASYYGQHIFERVPSESAKLFGDNTWEKVVYAQILVAQILSLTGTDFLLQDVDVLWYRDPLEYFAKRENEEVDIYFMEDGQRSRQFPPYGANTGFQYVKNNQRTRHLFSNFLGIADNTLNRRNDQSVMNMLLQVHSTQYGLNVKTIPREEPLFLGGWHSFQRKDMMEQVMKEEITPYTYHAHWTQPDQKHKFLKQLGLWHLKPQCANNALSSFNVTGDGRAALVGRCCLAEPLFKCFYKNIPSKKPCLSNVTYSW